MTQLYCARSGVSNEVECQRLNFADAVTVNVLLRAICRVGPTRQIARNRSFTVTASVRRR